jgi:hypothetical protein
MVEGEGEAEAGSWWARRVLCKLFVCGDDADARLCHAVSVSCVCVLQMAQQQPGYPPPPQQQQPGYPAQQPGYPPMEQMQQQPGYAPMQPQVSFAAGRLLLAAPACMPSTRVGAALRVGSLALLLSARRLPGKCRGCRPGVAACGRLMGLYL